MEGFPRASSSEAMNKGRTIAEGIVEAFKDKSGVGFSEAEVKQAIEDKAQEAGISAGEVMSHLEFERGGDDKNDTSTAYAVLLKK